MHGHTKSTRVLQHVELLNTIDTAQATSTRVLPIFKRAHTWVHINKFSFTTVAQATKSGRPEPLTVTIKKRAKECTGTRKSFENTIAAMSKKVTDVDITPGL